MIAKPNESLVPEYYRNYFRLCSAEDLSDELIRVRDASVAIMETIPEEMGNFAYDKGKWTIKELICHLTDTERVFAYRALAFSRKDTAELPGFGENEYAANCNASRRSIEDLQREFSLVRDSTVELFRFMSEDMLDFEGRANEVVITPRIIGWIIAGHNIHHLNVLRHRYLNFPA